MVSWSGASDSGIGVHGYAVAWTQVSNTLPAATETTTNSNATSPTLAKVNTWYEARILIDEAGGFGVQVWKQSIPTIVYQWGSSSPVWNGNAWTYNVSVKSGTLDIDYYKEETSYMGKRTSLTDGSGSTSCKGPE